MKEYFIHTILKILDSYLIYLKVYDIQGKKSINDKFKYITGLDDINLEEKIDECVTIDDQINLLYKVFAYARKSYRHIRCTLSVKKDYIQIFINDTCIHFYYNGDNLEPTLVTLNHNFITTLTKAKFKLIATLYPEDVLYRSLTWSSTDENIATVDRFGNVTVCNTPGECSIIVRASNNVYSQCNITVIQNVEELIDSVNSFNRDLLLIKDRLDVTDENIRSLYEFFDEHKINAKIITDDLQEQILNVKELLTEIEVYESEHMINIKSKNIKYIE